mgnify:CR=1 FL=1
MADFMQPTENYLTGNDVTVYAFASLDLKEDGPTVVEIPPAEEPKRQYGTGKGVVEVPALPPESGEGMVRARELFARGCAPCHGPAGKGDGPQEHFDSLGRPTSRGGCKGT